MTNDKRRRNNRCTKSGPETILRRFRSVWMSMYRQKFWKECGVCMWTWFDIASRIITPQMLCFASRQAAHLFIKESNSWEPNGWFVGFGSSSNMHCSSLLRLSCYLWILRWSLVCFREFSHGTLDITVILKNVFCLYACHVARYRYALCFRIAFAQNFIQTSSHTRSCLSRGTQHSATYDAYVVCESLILAWRSRTRESL